MVSEHQKVKILRLVFLLLIAALNSQLVDLGFIRPSTKRSTGGVSAEGEKAAKKAFLQDFPQV